MATSLLDTSTPQGVWQLSPEYTAARLLALVTVLRGFLVFDGMIIVLSPQSITLNYVEECEQYANQVATFYIATLPDMIGQLWQAPSLSFLAQYWFHMSCMYSSLTLSPGLI